eukprot:CAMPEP_0198216388 /NCGR_PEP_ID=MMETSP1445-20131203/57117_1 /TAXON_ID=36898 /ORGANISM="Pyramimonas sp., Strain CCMP2087" /LENGTH=56 /DNA_ID=CAMNT_0043892605 /DNA_START=63 /DNA_END=230 /DNA_ORIENTATION=-
MEPSGVGALEAGMLDGAPPDENCTHPGVPVRARQHTDTALAAFADDDDAAALQDAA